MEKNTEINLEKWTSLDLENCTAEELENEISRLSILKDQYSNLEQAIKIFINSVYGACGSPWFVFYNLDVAEAVTLQGQDLIKYSEKILNRYFLEFWHKDSKLHEKLGISNVEQLEKPVVVYIDTDSNYVTFEEILQKSSWAGSSKELVLGIYENFLKEYLGNCYSVYAKKYGTTNYQEFELEAISDSGIFLSKKKYVYNPIWKDPGIDIAPFSKITAKGVEIVQSSSSQYIRETLISLLKYILEKKKSFSVGEFAVLLKKHKEEFKLKNIDDIAMSSAIGDYEKYVLSDQKKLVLEKGCPMHVRAAAIYNYSLNSSKYKKKYQLIRTGEKVRYYHSEGSDEENVFAYIPGAYPYELAPAMDFDTQFNKSIIQPINRFIIAMGLSPVSPKLAVSTQLF
jgi:DNA polymerase elongation subunit (family B)